MKGGKTDAAKPFVKWVGGKTQLLSQLTPLFPRKFGRYFEPFLGGGAVFFAIRPTRATINDINQTLVAAYAQLRDDVQGVIRDLRKIGREFGDGDIEDRKATYYAIRERYNALPPDSPARVPLFLFLNRTAFNGVYRENSKGHFNVPIGSYLNPRIVDENNLRLVGAALAGTKITSLPFEASVADAKRGDFVYFDPPYHPLSRTSSFTGYSKGSFGEADQVRLRDLFVKLHKKGVRVMLSNSNAPLIRKLYADFTQAPVSASRMVNAKADRRGKITELVILSYDPAQT
jgi:DNA adenine methylase